MHFVYVLEHDPTGHWYIGQTNNIVRRIKEHNTRKNISTARDGLWQMIYYEAYLLKEDALGREKFLKSGAGWRFLKKQFRHYLATQSLHEK